MSFAQLKKNRSNSLKNLQAQVEKMSQKGYSDPMKEKYWTPTTDSAGNGFAIIRFLPEPDGEDSPYVRIWNHGFKGPTGLWYIENSLTTIDQDDPVSKLNSKLWNSSTDDKGPERTQARDQKRKVKFHSNILVVKDSANPENEGKVFLYAYGKKIFDKLNDLMNPAFEDEKPVNPFDFWEGANFKLKIRKVEGYPNYDKSEFDEPSALFDGDEEKLEELYKQLHSLKDLKDPKNFKSYEELEAKLFRVLGISGDTTRTPTSKTADEVLDGELDMTRTTAPKSASASKKSKEADVAPSPSISEDEDDDELAFFRSLSN